jgi:hypothetical protein
LIVSFALWVALSVAVLAGRAQYDRRLRTGARQLSRRAVDRLLRRALGRPRTDWGRWRRITAINRLAAVRHPAMPHMLYHALWHSDAEVAAAAIRVLGRLGDTWAMELLVAALRDGRVPRSRVAAQLERLGPEPTYLLLPLLRDPDPAVRFWAATLIGPNEAVGGPDLVELTRDDDPNVRAAAVEALASRRGDDVVQAALDSLDDAAWFVRVHAARTAGHVGGAAAAPQVANLLTDERWWVRTAAKDALETIGQDAVPALVAMLGSDDQFGRNGAAEVLQDIGLVDHLAVEEPESPLLARIYAAGGQRFKEAAEARTRRAVRAGEERAA